MRLHAGVAGQPPSPGFSTPAETSHSLSALQNPGFPAASEQPVPAGLATQHISVGRPFASQGGAISQTVPSLLHRGVSGQAVGGFVGCVLMHCCLWHLKPARGAARPLFRLGLQGVPLGAATQQREVWRPRKHLGS